MRLCINRLFAFPDVRLFFNRLFGAPDDFRWTLKGLPKERVRAFYLLLLAVILWWGSAQFKASWSFWTIIPLGLAWWHLFTVSKAPLPKADEEPGKAGEEPK